MAKALELIRTLETEIARDAVIRAELRIVLNLCRSENGRKTVDRQILSVSTRILRAQREIFAIESAYFAEIKKALRAEQYPPIPAVQPSRIGYAD